MGTQLELLRGVRAGWGRGRGRGGGRDHHAIDGVHLWIE